MRLRAQGRTAVREPSAADFVGSEGNVLFLSEKKKYQKELV